MKFARIEGNVVVELLSTEGDITQMFHPSLVWVDCTGISGCSIGWSYSNGVFSAPAGPALGQAQAAQIALMAQAYQSAISQNVTFTTAGGVSKSFQADAASLDNVQYMLSAYTPKGAVPTGFYWLSADNTKVPFTLADLQGLAKAMGDQGWAAFQNLQTRKASILAATTAAAVQAIGW